LNGKILANWKDNYCKIFCENGCFRRQRELGDEYFESKSSKPNDLAPGIFISTEPTNDAAACYTNNLQNVTKPQDNPIVTHVLKIIAGMCMLIVAFVVAVILFVILVLGISIFSNVFVLIALAVGMNPPDIDTVKRYNIIACVCISWFIAFCLFVN